MTVEGGDGAVHGALSGHAGAGAASPPRVGLRLPALVATSLVIATALVVAGPHGTDFAAHVYQRLLFLRHGFVLWNNDWYAGRYTFAGYSLLYYPLAAVLGIEALAVVSIVAAVAAFAALVQREWGPEARVAAGVFAVVWPATAITGEFPFLLGSALALGALLALQRRRAGVFGLLVLLCLLASPLAFLFLALVAAAAAVTRLDQPRRLLVPGAVLAAAGALGLGLALLFPAGGTFVFPTSWLLETLLFAATGAALAWRRSRLLRALFLVYGAASAIAFLAPSELGGNVSRLRLAALPLILLALGLRRFRPRLAALVLIPLAAVWNLYPLATNLVVSAGDPSASAAYWQPAVSFLRHRLTPSFRVEAVATADHWEALYLPRAGIPIARGWFRQDDFPENAVLYTPLGPAAYRRWLHRLGVRYVVLSDAPLDFSAQREAALLQSGRAGLPVVRRYRHLTVYGVPSPTPIVTGTGHATVLSLGEGTVRLRLDAAGSYRVAVRYSPYWAASRGCLQRRRDGMIELTVGRPGAVELRFAPGFGRALALLDGDGSCATARR